MSNTDKINLSFVAIDPYIQRNIILPTEKLSRGSNMMEWGDKNRYPDYLLDLYNSVPTLRSIINGNIDFIAGDDIELSAVVGKLNYRGDSIREQVRDIAKDYELYGGFALQIIRNGLGEVAEVYYIDMRYLRTNKECDVFYYSEKWNKGNNADAIVYPAFLPGLQTKWATLTDEQRNRHASSILFVKNVHTQTYPAPVYAASVKDCEIERNITDFHLNTLENGFTASALVNFNNGEPSDETKEQIEQNFNEKFSGHSNAGRIVFSYNDSRDSAATIQALKIEDFGERYNALSTHSRQQIFSAFRAVPALFGIMTESTGFNEQEFEQAFRLYNRTQVRPVQRMICDAYEKIYGQPVLVIKPFTLDEEVKDTNVN